MGRVPKNQIIEGLEAKEGEFVTANDGLPYSGKYHIISGIAYAGENEQSFPVPIPLDQVEESSLAGIISAVGFATAAYAMVKSNINMAKQTAEKIIPKANIRPEGEGTASRTGKSIFTQKTNDPDKIIKEIKYSKLSAILVETLKKDPLYKIVEINFDDIDVTQQINNGDEIIPGLSEFLYPIDPDDDEGKA
jgi:hypothetical protein